MNETGQFGVDSSVPLCNLPVGFAASNIGADTLIVAYGSATSEDGSCVVSRNDYDISLQRLDATSMQPVSSASSFGGYIGSSGGFSYFDKLGTQMEIGAFMTVNRGYGGVAFQNTTVRAGGSVPFEWYDVNMATGTSDGRVLYYYGYSYQFSGPLYALWEVNLQANTSSLIVGDANRDADVPVVLTSPAPGVAVFLNPSGQLRAHPGDVNVTLPVNVSDVTFYDICSDPLFNDTVYVLFGVRTPGQPGLLFRVNSTNGKILSRTPVNQTVQSIASWSDLIVLAAERELFIYNAPKDFDSLPNLVTTYNLPPYGGSYSFSGGNIQQMQLSPSKSDPSVVHLFIFVVGGFAQGQGRWRSIEIKMR